MNTDDTDTDTDAGPMVRRVIGKLAEHHGREATKRKPGKAGRPKLEDGRTGTVRVRATTGEIADLEARATAAGLKYPAYLRSLLFEAELEGEPFTDRQWRNRFRKLMAANAALQAKIEELQDDAEMSCITPADNCQCSGCLTAAERNA